MSVPPQPKFTVDKLRELLPESLREMIFYASFKSYQNALDGHMPELGANNLTYGVNAHFYLREALRQAAKDSDGMMSVKESHNSFRLRVGTTTIAMFKVGTSEKQSINASLPRKISGKKYKSKKAEENPNQLSLFDGLEESYILDVAYPFDLVLAHFGNSEQGLRAIYICEPKIAIGQIVGWQTTDLIWQADTEAGQTNDSKMSKVSDEIIPKPVVLRKSKKAKENG